MVFVFFDDEICGELVIVGGWVLSESLDWKRSPFFFYLARWVNFRCKHDAWVGLRSAFLQGVARIFCVCNDEEVKR